MKEETISYKNRHKIDDPDPVKKNSQIKMNQSLPGNHYAICKNPED